jgi:hypothetical protein
MEVKYDIDGVLVGTSSNSLGHVPSFDCSNCQGCSKHPRYCAITWLSSIWDDRWEKMLGKIQKNHMENRLDFKGI